MFRLLVLVGVAFSLIGSGKLASWLARSSLASPLRIVKLVDRITRCCVTRCVLYIYIYIRLVAGRVASALPSPTCPNEKRRVDLRAPLRVFRWESPRYEFIISTRPLWTGSFSPVHLPLLRSSIITWVEVLVNSCWSSFLTSSQPLSLWMMA